MAGCQTGALFLDWFAEIRGVASRALLGRLVQAARTAYCESFDCQAQNENSTDERWGAEEIALAAEAYMNMLEDEIAGREINKTAMREKLRAGGLSGRSDGAIEYRSRISPTCLSPWDALG
jgi:hypothetical protein